MTKRWTDAEDEVLRANYADSTIDILIELLPDRTVQAIQTRAKTLRLSKSYSSGWSTRWTDAEDEILRANYAESTMTRLLELLPGRTKGGIYLRAFNLRISKPLPEPKPPKPPKEPKPIGKPKGSTGLKPGPKPNPKPLKRVHFSYTELQTLRDFGSVLNMPELRMLIPRKSIGQILDAADDYDIRLVNREYWQQHVYKINEHRTIA